MYRADIGFISCDGMVVSGTDDDTKVSVDNSSELARYRLSIFFILSIEFLEVFVSSVSADGGQGWELEIYLFEIDWFGCCGNILCNYFVK